MTPEDLNCYRVNYNAKFWTDRAEQIQQNLCVPVGAVLAVNALCDEVESLRRQLTEANSRESYESWLASSRALEVAELRDKFAECERERDDRLADAKHYFEWLKKVGEDLAEAIKERDKFRKAYVGCVDGHNLTLDELDGMGKDMQTLYKDYFSVVKQRDELVKSLEAMCSAVGPLTIRLTKEQSQYQAAQKGYEMKILIDEEVVKQALDALEEVEFGNSGLCHICRTTNSEVPGRYKHQDNCTHKQSITAIRSALDAAEKVEPYAYEYTSKITGTTTVTHQPPDRVIEPDQFYIVPLFKRPEPAMPEGWKLVPIEPTEEMLDAYERENGGYHTYKAMLNAAPKGEK